MSDVLHFSWHLSIQHAITTWESLLVSSDTNQHYTIGFGWTPSKIRIKFGASYIFFFNFHVSGGWTCTGLSVLASSIMVETLSHAFCTQLYAQQHASVYGWGQGLYHVLLIILFTKRQRIRDKITVFNLHVNTKYFLIWCVPVTQMHCRSINCY